jgi:hypothetical protein
MPPAPTQSREEVEVQDASCLFSLRSDFLGTQKQEAGFELVGLCCRS